MAKLRWLLIAGIVLAALLAAVIFCNAFAQARTVVYTIPSAKLSGGSLRLALVADLHGARYGRGQRQLMAQLEEYAPDAVLLAGDIFDATAPFYGSRMFLEAVGSRYPCYFVFGNHEHATRRVEDIRKIVEGAGITILEGDCEVFTTADGLSLYIAGVDDVYRARTNYRTQLAAARATLEGADMFSVLLSHEPQFVDELRATGADLIVSGHTHGGQWSIPGLMNGFYAPGQGFLPKYAGGLYDFGDQRLVISRGLAKTPLWAPRIFTPRELVFLDIVPAGGA